VKATQRTVQSTELGVHWSLVRPNCLLRAGAGALNASPVRVGVEHDCRSLCRRADRGSGTEHSSLRHVSGERGLCGCADEHGQHERNDHLRSRQRDGHDTDKVETLNPTATWSWTGLRASETKIAGKNDLASPGVESSLGSFTMVRVDSL
jgi:hypothetical protein